MFLYYTAQNLFFAELLHKLVYIEDAPYFIFPIFIPILLWLISKNIFKKTSGALVSTTILLLSPWFWYLVVAHSLYIFLFFLILTVIYGVTLVQSEQLVIGNVLVIIAGVTAIYTSSILFVLIPLILLILLASKIVNFKSIRISLVCLAILATPLLFFIDKNKSGFKNSLSNQAMIFEDPSLLNSINKFQGAATEKGFKKLARISENKYIFFSEYLGFKYITQFVPVNFFTPQYKLLGFSFSPPIFVGLAIPFTYGLYLALSKKGLRKIIYISTILAIPSIMAHDQVSLNRLILFSPVVILLISYGLISLYNKRSNIIARNFLVLSLILVVFQLFVTLYDVKYREEKRFAAYFGKKYELIEP